MYFSTSLCVKCVNKVRCKKNMNTKKNNSKKSDIKDRTIARQTKEIEFLKKEVSKLKAMCEEKDAIIKEKENEAADFTASVESLRCELRKNIDELKQKSKEYDENLAEIKNMKMIFNQELFKGKWSLVKFLIK